jgi:hypothetical protein
MWGARSRERSLRCRQRLSGCREPDNSDAQLTSNKIIDLVTVRTAEAKLCAVFHNHRRLLIGPPADFLDAVSPDHGGAMDADESSPLKLGFQLSQRFPHQMDC